MRLIRAGTLTAAAAALLVAACDTARPIQQRFVQEEGDPRPAACVRCHGFPPPPGAFEREVDHPQETACHVCHRTTAAAPGDVLIPDGDHLNGRVDLAWHPVPYSIPAHAADAITGARACAFCHGADFGGGVVGVSCNACHGQFGFPDWNSNCSFCHGTRTPGWTPAQQALAAPPQGIAGENSPAERAVGGHQRHLGVGATMSNGFACSECHPARGPVVPLPPGEDTQRQHLDGVVQMAWGPIATAQGALPTWDGTSCSNYCHGATLPGAPRTVAWAPPAPLDCNSCHEGDPSTGRHPAVSPGHQNFACRVCHGGAVYAVDVADPARHVNGTIDMSSLPVWNPAQRSCTAVCHPAERSWGP
jgi:hypothetical protein